MLSDPPTGQVLFSCQMHRDLSGMCGQVRGDTASKARPQGGHREADKALWDVTTPYGPWSSSQVLLTSRPLPLVTPCSAAIWASVLLASNLCLVSARLSASRGPSKQSLISKDRVGWG